jgi:SAM-dependent methyltransferase
MLTLAATLINVSKRPATLMSLTFMSGGGHRDSGAVAPSEGRTPIYCIICGQRCVPLRRLPGLVQCTACDLISADVNLSDDELRALYSWSYFNGQEYLDYLAEEASLRKNFRNRLKTLRSLTANLLHSELLELGCAYGFFLDEVRTSVASAWGIDISADAVRFARTERHVNVVQGDYLSINLGRKVDVVVMWDTIEHLKHPQLFVEKIAQDLKPGGVLALTTGDIGALAARLLGRRWRLIHPPSHLHYFSAATMSNLLHQKGFDVIHLSHPGNSRSLRFALYFVTVLQMKRPQLYKALEGFRLFDRHATINLYDIMYVIARRR